MQEKEEGTVVTVTVQARNARLVLFLLKTAFG
jgi:hypothetical protein